MHYQLLQGLTSLALSLGLVAPAVPPVFPGVQPVAPKPSMFSVPAASRDWSYYMQLGENAYLRDDAQACERYFKAALSAAKGNREQTIETLDSLDQLYDATGDETSQRLNLLQLLDVLQSVSKPDSRTAETYSELASLSIFQNKAVAEMFALSAVREYHRLRDTRSFDYAVTLNNLAWIEAELGKYREAECNYTRSIYLLEHDASASKVVTGMISNNLAELYMDQEKTKQAQRAYIKSLKYLVQSAGPHNALVQSIYKRYRQAGGSLPLPGR